TYKEIQSEVRDHLQNNIYKNSDEDKVFIIKSESGKVYAISTKHHFVGELQSLIGDREYQRILNSEIVNSEKSQHEKNSRSEVMKAVDEMLFEVMKTSGISKDPGENELKRK